MIHESGTHESGRLFIDLPPPPGGFQRLQRRLDGQARPRPLPAWRIAASTLALSMIALAWLLPGWVAQRQYRAELASAVEAAIAAPAGGIRVTDGAAMELPSDQANVRLYLVQSVTRTRTASETGPAR